MVSTGFSKIDYPIITHYPLIPNSKSLLNKIGRIFPYYRHPQKGLRNQMGVFQNVINPKKVCGIKCCFSKCDHPQKVCLTIITNGHQSSPSTRVTYRLVKVDTVGNPPEWGLRKTGSSFSTVLVRYIVTYLSISHGHGMLININYYYYYPILYIGAKCNLCCSH